MTRRHPKPLRERLRSLYSWHRWLGVVSALFVIWLAVTGIALEHGSLLELDRRQATSGWLHRHYGIQINVPAQALELDENWLSHVDGRLYLNEHMIDHAPPPVGLARLGMLWAVATRESLWLLNDDAEVLEELHGLDLPGRITALANSSNGLLLVTERGSYIADPLDPSWPDWVASERALNPPYTLKPLPHALRSQLHANALGRALNWERVLLDAHSGRLFGQSGVWLMDAMAVAFIVLSVSGLWLWLRYRNARRARLRRQKSN